MILDRDYCLKNSGINRFFPEQNHVMDLLLKI